jgi:1,5-anhydro-D-fructose reductase (1,5-anhydro-D-mannitol-forming)
VTQRGLRWGLIGASDIAETRMVPAILRVGDEVRAVYSGSATHGAAFAARNAIPDSCDSILTLLDRDDIDAVYVSSKNDQHRGQVEAAALAGKHVLCEKPVANTLPEARAMIDVCERQGVVFAVNHHLPAAGTHARIRALVHEGAIGKPLAVNVRHATLLPERLRGWRLSAEPGAGVVMDLTGHDASVVNPLLRSQAEDAVASSVRQGPWDSQADDACISVVRYAPDVLVHMHDSFTSPFTETYLEVHGDAGSITARNVMTPEPIGDVFLTSKSGRHEVEVLDRRHTYDITLLAFRDAIAGNGRPIVSGADAFAALAVTLAVARAAATGARAPIERL